MRNLVNQNLFQISTVFELHADYTKPESSNNHTYSIYIKWLNFFTSAKNVMALEIDYLFPTRLSSIVRPRKEFN